MSTSGGVRSGGIGTSGGRVSVALLADAHGNLPALEAVLAHARLQPVDEFWFLGDFVGYGPFPDEVVRRLMGLGAVCISGNYDRKSLRLGDPKAVEKLRESKSPDKFLAFKWAYDHLSDESRAALGSLPEQRRFDVGGLRVLMTHASPESRKEHLTPKTPESRLAELAETAHADVVLVGHSHEALQREAAGVRFINPGSVGRPDDGDPRAAYALLTFEQGCLEVDLRRVAYDVAAAVEAVRAAGLPEAFAQMFMQGRDLNAVKGKDKTKGKKDSKKEEARGPKPDAPAGKYDRA